MTIIIINIIMYVICSEVTLRGWQDVKIQELIPTTYSPIELAGEENAHAAQGEENAHAAQGEENAHAAQGE